MDSGLIFVFGVAFGLLGGVGFILLLISSDDYATAYFRAYWSNLGGQREQVEAQDVCSTKENVSQSIQSGSGERPGASGSAPGILALLLVVLLGGCASAGGGVGDVQAEYPGLRSHAHLGSEPSPTSPRTEDLPVCGFEAPYLPDPCRMQVAPGEWLRISNPRPKETKRHGWLWWLLVGLVTL